MGGVMERSQGIMARTKRIGEVRLTLLQLSYRGLDGMNSIPHQQTMRSVKDTLLKKYYEIVNEDRPLSHFFLQTLICLQKCVSNHETKQSSKFQSDPSPNSFRRLKI